MEVSFEEVFDVDAIVNYDIDSFRSVFNLFVGELEKAEVYKTPEFAQVPRNTILNDIYYKVLSYHTIVDTLMDITGRMEFHKMGKSAKGDLFNIYKSLAATNGADIEADCMDKVSRPANLDGKLQTNFAEDKARMVEYYIKVQELLFIEAINAYTAQTKQTISADTNIICDTIKYVSGLEDTIKFEELEEVVKKLEAKYKSSNTLEKYSIIIMLSSEYTFDPRVFEKEHAKYINEIYGSFLDLQRKVIIKCARKEPGHGQKVKYLNEVISKYEENYKKAKAELESRHSKVKELYNKGPINDDNIDDLINDIVNYNLDGDDDLAKSIERLDDQQHERLAAQSRDNSDEQQEVATE